MSTSSTVEYGNVLGMVRAWPPEMRLKLAEDVLHSLQPELRSEGRRGLPAEKVRGIGAGNGPPPDDQTIRQWMDEHRQEKHG